MPASSRRWVVGNRNGAVFSLSSFRAPAAMQDVQLYHDIEGCAVDARLAARNDFRDHPFTLIYRGAYPASASASLTFSPT